MTGKILKGTWVVLKETALDGDGELLARRPITQTERDQWRQDQRDAIAAAREAGEDTFSIAFDSAGEPRLPPTSVAFMLHRGIRYKVAKARCQVSLGYGNPVTGMTALRDPLSGETVYVKRRCLEVAGATKEEVEVADPTIMVDTWSEARGLSVDKDTVDAHIPAWLERVNEWRKARHEARFSNLPYRPVEVAEGGRKYAKIVDTSGVYCFVERATGHIYKAKSYKAPETNFPRGSIFVNDIAHAVGDYGANYAS